MIHHTPYTIRLFNNNDYCYTDITIQTPALICYGECDIIAAISSLTYNDNGTAAILTDDFFTFQITVSNVSGTGWISDSHSGNYGEVVDFGPYPVDQQGVIINIRDSQNPNCQVSIGANMNSCGYTGDCNCCGG